MLSVDSELSAVQINTSLSRRGLTVSNLWLKAKLDLGACLAGEVWPDTILNDIRVGGVTGVGNLALLILNLVFIFNYHY